MNKTEVLDIEIPNKKKKNILKKLIIILLFFLVFLALIIYILYSFLLSSVSNKSIPIKFKVESGSSVYSVGESLKKEGLIRNISVYKIYVKLNNINNYKAGTYSLDKSYSLQKIVSILNGNKYSDGVRITFKEGKTIRNVAKTIAQNTKITEDEVFDKLNDNEYIDSLINKYWFLTEDLKNSNIYYPLEGYLYPETYYFNENVTVEEIFNTMLEQTNTIYSKYKDDFNSSAYGINEIITLASLVEQEGIYEADRNKIASVFYNRLKANMSLGSDVTTYYAFKVDMGTRDLTTEEFNTYNPYNTRGPSMNGKLPIGPISNISETSLKAALYPKQTNYYYFVADKNGKTHFTKTYEEHQKVIKELKESGNWIEL